MILLAPGGHPRTAEIGRRRLLLGVQGCPLSVLEYVEARRWSPRVGGLPGRVPPWQRALVERIIRELAAATELLADPALAAERARGRERRRASSALGDGGAGRGALRAVARRGVG